MKLSIITVCKNAELTIERTILSVINQSYTDFEYIIVDGASSDKTLEIVEKYSDKISKVISEHDNGIYHAMNKGIGLSSGEYLLFINTGDYLLNPNVLKKVFTYELREDIIYSLGLIELPNGFLFIRSFPEKISKTHMYYDTIPHQDSLTKRDVFQKQGGFDESYKIAGDYEFFLRAIYQNNFKTQLITEFISVNDLKGVSSQKKFKALSKKERLNAAMKYYSKYLVWFYQLFKPEYLLVIKYPKYMLDFIKSIFKNNKLRNEY